jgi:hypothetical protein
MQQAATQRPPVRPQSVQPTVRKPARPAPRIRREQPLRLKVASLERWLDLNA